MDVREGDGVWTSSGDSLCPPPRVGTPRSRPGSASVTCPLRSPDMTAVARTAPTADGSELFDLLPGPAPKDRANSRSAYQDNLCSIGLPGEDAMATFELISIEPYEPAAAAAPPNDDRSPRAQGRSAPSSTASPFTFTTSVAAVAIAGALTSPRPPPVSANQRTASGHRPACRRASSISAASMAAGAALASPPSTPPPCVPETSDAHGPDACTWLRTSLSGREACVGVNGVDCSPRRSAAGGGNPSAGGTGGALGSPGGADGRPGTPSSFLDPSRPSVRRLLPPLMRASEALYDASAAVAGCDFEAEVAPAAAAATCAGGLPSRSSGDGLGGGSSGPRLSLDLNSPRMAGLSPRQPTVAAAASFADGATDPPPQVLLAGRRGSAELAARPVSARRLSPMPPLEPPLGVSVLFTANYQTVCADGDASPGVRSALTAGDVAYNDALAAAAAKFEGQGNGGGSIRPFSESLAGSECDGGVILSFPSAPTFRATTMGLTSARFSLDAKQMRSSSFKATSSGSAAGMLSPQTSGAGVGAGGLMSPLGYDGGQGSPGKPTVDRACRIASSMTCGASRPPSAAGGPQGALPPILDRPGSAARRQTAVNH